MESCVSCEGYALNVDLGTVELVSHAGHVSKNSEWMDLAAVSKCVNKESPGQFTIDQTISVCLLWRNICLAVKISGLEGQIFYPSLSRTQWTQTQDSQVQEFLWDWKAL